MAAKGQPISQPTPREVWDRLDDESPKAHAAFVQYRDLGTERSIDKTRIKLGKRSGYARHLETWSSQYRWVERAAAWGAAEQKRKDAERAIDERRVWKKAQADERDRRKALLNRMAALLGASFKDHITIDGEGKPTASAPDPESLRSIAGAFKTYMEQSRQEFNDLPTQKVAPVDASDPEGETPYQPRLDDFTRIITSVKELLEQERRDDD